MYGIKQRNDKLTKNSAKLGEALDLTAKSDEPPPEPQFLADHFTVYDDRI